MLGLLVLTLVPSLHLHAQTHPPERVLIKEKRLAIVRRGAVARRFPDRRRATVSYPLVSGLRNPTVLRRVRSILSIKNLFGSSLDEYRNDPWLEELSYVVDFNQNHLLDVTFTQVGTAAYPDSQSRHLLINLRDGSLVQADQVFGKAGLEELIKSVDAELQKEIVDLIQVVKQDGSLVGEEKKNLIDALELQKFERQNLDDFSVNKDGLTFLYDAGFPHVIQAFEPEGRYFFPYAKLKDFILPASILGQFVN